MIAVSSHRPFKDCPKEIISNQIKAKKSWDKSFSHVYYFGDLEKELCGEHTTFIHCAGKPKIKDLAAFCADLPGWSCLINSDIVVGEHFKTVEQSLITHEALCAISRRYDLPELILRDLGLDFFAAVPSVWGAVTLEISEAFTIGRIMWDSWMVNFFAETFKNHCFDITDQVVIYHPVHGHRNDQALKSPDAPFLHKHGWPSRKLRRHAS